jgi:gas vesicle protein
METFIVGLFIGGCFGVVAVLLVAAWIAGGRDETRP